jgi:intracellular septation protein
VNNAPERKAAPTEIDTADPRQLLKSLIELGPLLFFGVTYYVTKSMLYATGALMVSTIAALIASRVLFGRLPVMPLVSGALVMVFGGLTLWLQDAVFIKMKPTILYLLFAIVLLSGAVLGKYFLRYVFGELFRLTDAGWRVLTIRWIVFFVVLALLNEIVWRNFSDGVWLWFKLALLPITAVFGVAQLGLIKQHSDTSASV